MNSGHETNSGAENPTPDAVEPLRPWEQAALPDGPAASGAAQLPLPHAESWHTASAEVVADPAKADAVPAEETGGQQNPYPSSSASSNSASSYSASSYSTSSYSASSGSTGQQTSAQSATPAYGQSQPSQPSYGQSSYGSQASQPYGQVQSGQPASAASASYSQSSYGQSGQSSYGQSGQSSYGQSGQSSFGQSGQSSYGQSGQSSSGQSGQSSYGQYSYGQRYPAPTQPGQAVYPPPGPPSAPTASRRGLLVTIGAAAATALVVGGGASVASDAARQAWRDAEARRNQTPTPTPTPTPSGAVAAQVTDKVMPSTVMLQVRTASGVASGSGFVVNSDGLLYTNNHVIEAADQGTLTVYFSDGTSSNGEVVGRSPAYDLAVVRVTSSATALVPAVLGDSDAVRVGDVVVAIGSPLGLVGTVTQGIVSAKHRAIAVGESEQDAAFIDALQTDAPINPGNSGGPLSDAEGRIIGINSAIRSNTTGSQRPGSIGIGFAIPMNQAKAICEELISNGRATYPTIGVTVQDMPNRSGVRIVDVVAGSPGASAGLAENDVITKVDDRVVITQIEFIVAIRVHRPKEEVTITYTRTSAESEVTMTLGEQEG